jgi:hypothetical protein
MFDNCMALTSGKQAEEDSWTKTLPLVSSLTKRQIGQLWVNHTGHNTERSYGTKTREWRMDTTIHLTAIERSDADISFAWEFRKARERTPQNRADFVDVTIALVDDKWVGSGGATRRKGKPSDQEAGLLRVLAELIKGPTMVMHRGCMAIHSDSWRDACLQRGLVPNAHFQNLSVSAGPEKPHRMRRRTGVGNLGAKWEYTPRLCCAPLKNLVNFCCATPFCNKPATNRADFVALCCRPVAGLLRRCCACCGPLRNKRNNPLGVGAVARGFSFGP